MNNQENMMIPTILKALILLSTVAIFCSGCASSTPTNFYVLQPIEPVQETIPVATRKSFTVGIGPVEIPKLLDRTQIVTKHENNRVELAEFHQWGEPLKENVVRVLARNIASLRATDVVRSYPWGAFGSVDYRVVLNFLQFDSIPGHAVTLEVDWTITNEKNHKILKNGHSTIEQPLENNAYTRVVEVMSKALGELSQKLSSELDNVANQI